MQRRFLLVWLSRLIPCHGPCHGRAKRTTRTPLNSHELMSRYVSGFVMYDPDIQFIGLIDKNANEVGRDRLHHNPCVEGSSPSSATNYSKGLANFVKTHSFYLRDPSSVVKSNE